MLSRGGPAQLCMTPRPPDAQRQTRDLQRTAVSLYTVLQPLDGGVDGHDALAIHSAAQHVHELCLTLRTILQQCQSLVRLFRATHLDASVLIQPHHTNRYRLASHA